jgi:hypothetical protein
VAETKYEFSRQVQGMIISTILACSVSMQASSPMLLKAQRVADVRGWNERIYRVADYHWVNPEAIMFSRKIQGEQIELCLFNPLSQKISTAGFTRRFRETLGDLDTIKVSPDGKMVLWSGKTDNQFRWFVSPLNGSILKSFPRRKTSEVISNHGPDDETCAFWSSDGKSVFESMIEFGNGTSTQLWGRSLKSIEKETTYEPAKGYVDWQPDMIVEKLALAQSGLAIGGPRSSVGLITWNIESPKSTRVERKVTVPKGRTISSFSFSPKGTEILWDLSVQLSKDSQNWDSSGEEIWLTDAKGRHWRKVTEIGFDPKQRDKQAQSLGKPKWRPDGKAFSFIFESKLYQYPFG